MTSKLIYFCEFRQAEKEGRIKKNPFLHTHLNMKWAMLRNETARSALGPYFKLRISEVKHFMLT